jgi:hypothetical protein
LGAKGAYVGVGDEYYGVAADHVVAVDTSGAGFVEIYRGLRINNV